MDKRDICIICGHGPSSDKKHGDYGWHVIKGLWWDGFNWYAGDSWTRDRSEVSFGAPICYKCLMSLVPGRGRSNFGHTAAAFINVILEDPDILYSLKGE